MKESQQGREDSGPVRKKVKLSKKNSRKQKSSEHSFADDTPITFNKKTKKKSVGFELAHQMKKWQEKRRLA